MEVVLYGQRGKVLAKDKNNYPLGFYPNSPVAVNLSAITPIAKTVPAGSQSQVWFAFDIINMLNRPIGIVTLSGNMEGTALGEDAEAIYWYDGTNLLGVSKIDADNSIVLSTDEQPCVPSCEPLFLVPRYSKKTINVRADIAPSATSGSTMVFQITGSDEIQTPDRLPIFGKFPITGNEFTIK